MSQTGVRPTQAVEFIAVHWTHLLVSPSHAGVNPVHAMGSASVHWTQVSVTLLHTGVGAAQSALPTHSTQAPPEPPCPLHTSGVAHGWRGLFCPAGSGVQVPTVLESAQLLQVPLQPVLQQ